MKLARFLSTVVMALTASVLAVSAVLAFWEFQSPLTVLGLVMMSTSAFWGAMIIRPRKIVVRIPQRVRAEQPVYQEMGQ